MKKILIIILSILLLLISGCSLTKKIAPSGKAASNKNAQKDIHASAPSIPEVPEGCDPELWMGSFGNLQIDDNTGALYIVDSNNNKTLISDKTGSESGPIFKVSPDRTSVVYVETNTDQQKYDVAVYNVRDKKSHYILKDVTSLPQYIHWSYDSNLIGITTVNYTDDLSKTTFDCTLYESGKGDIVAKIPAVDFNWSLDSSSIVFMKVPENVEKYMIQGEDLANTLSNTMGIYNLSTGKTNYYTLENDELIFSTPEYSKDGSRIFFISSKFNSKPSTFPADPQSLINEAIYVFDSGSTTPRRIVDNDYINSSNPDNGYGIAKLDKDLLAYGGLMKDSVKVVNLKTGQSKVYTGLIESEGQEDTSFMWQADNSLKINLKNGTHVIIGQNMKER